jgi:hypothetical protein
LWKTNIKFKYISLLKNNVNSRIALRLRLMDENGKNKDENQNAFHFGACLV